VSTTVVSEVRTGTHGAAGLGAVPVALAGAGILTQIAYPLLTGTAVRVATVVAVVLLAGAALTHAAQWWGWPGAAALLGVAGGLGLAAEAAGVATGVPFGSYAYADSLGPKVIGVPLVVPLAWVMLAYPCLLLGRWLGGDRLRVAVLGGLALASWDLFLDPQMVAEGHWTWRFPEPALPGVPGVPLTNYAGWVVVSVVIVAALDRALPRPAGGARPARHAVPAAVLAWTWLGSTLGNLAFFDRPWVALYGGVAMGVLVAPYLAGLLTGRQR
jgi:uncharacterized membrane protein